MMSVFIYLSDFMFGRASIDDFIESSGKSKTSYLMSKFMVFRIYRALSNYILFNRGQTAFIFNSYIFC